jgi:hypothetical protein
MILALFVDQIFIFENKQIVIVLRYQNVFEKMKVIMNFFALQQDTNWKEVG